MTDRDHGPAMRTYVVIVVAVGLVTAGLLYALVAVHWGTPPGDQDSYVGKLGPDITVQPGLNPGDSPISGYYVLANSILHLWVNATGPILVVVTNPENYVIHEADAPVNLTYFATVGGYYEVTLIPKSSDVTAMLTVTSEPLQLAGSYREALLISLTMIVAGFSMAVLMIVFLTSEKE